jgi:peptidoglycan biosynthesis protein MviN/MurJ (putative lipid II flippase)
VNLVLMMILVGSLGYAGLALSVALSATVQICLLLILARRRFGSLPFACLGGHLLAFAAAGWLGVRIGAWFLASPAAASIPLGQIGGTVVAVGVAAMVYLIVTWLLGYRQLGGVRRASGRPKS